METTKLYVEYIIVGMETLAVIMLILFIAIGDDFLQDIIYITENIVPSIIMTGVCYILGLIVDRMADIFFEKRKNLIKEKYRTAAQTSIIVWEHYKQDTFATFTLSRIRLMRSTVLNSMLLVVFGPIAAWKYYESAKSAILFAVGFALVLIGSNKAHKNLLETYYKKTLKLEKSYLDEKCESN